MAQNAYIYFPKTDSLKGTAENNEVKGKNAISVLSVSHHISMPITGANYGDQARMGGRAMFGDISVSKYIDEVTPYLNQFTAGGNIIPTTVITWWSTGQADSSIAPVNLYEITLTDAIITSLSYSGSGGADNPVETMSLNFTKIQWKQTQMKNTSPGAATAPTTTTWDLFKNTP
jgi:type VI secretion system secreted protein Hcp